MEQSRYYRRQLLFLILLLCAVGVFHLQQALKGKPSEERPPGQEETDVRPREELFILGTAAQTEGLAEGEVLTDAGIRRTTIDLSDYRCRRVTAIFGTDEGAAAGSGQELAITEVVLSDNDALALPNIYILEARPDGICMLYENLRVWLPGVIDEDYDYEHVADLQLDDGAVQSIRIKGETIHGSILAVYDEKIELEGYGVLPLSPDFKIYENYGTPRELTSSELVVGYDIAEFVAADGVLCAGIVSAQPDMTSIRVAIGRTGYEGLYHSEIRIVPQCEVTLQTGDRREVLPAGEEIVFLPEYLEMEERVRLIPAAEDGTLTVQSVERAYGNPVYYGTLEINRREEGLLLINEVGLETYLCSVVPGEMPSSYEPEALKAQAVCARSYAVNQIRESKYQAYGAHVEDSVSSQVYNNIQRQDATTRAVYETAGETALYDGEVITAYYFSTSCGYTTTGGVWGGDADASPYLQSKAVCDENGTDYETEEAWYRWSTEGSGKAYWSAVARACEETAASNPDKVLIKGTDGSYEKGTFSGLGTITGIREGERLPGGVLHSVYIDGTKGSVELLTEYVIRKVLCAQGLKITRRDGSIVQAGSLLPSAFLELTAGKTSDGGLILTMYGGGYGHGAGMSQNGANRMAQQGKTYQEILTFFYDGITVGQGNTA